MDDRMVGRGVRFERIRRITGYLVGTVDRFNNAKKAEVRDRVRHLSVSAGLNTPEMLSHTIEKGAAITPRPWEKEKRE